MLSLITRLLSGVFIVSFLVPGLFDLTGFLTEDETLRPLFNPYLLGQSIGIRMVFGIVRDIQDQNILGLNVLTIRI